MCRWIAAFMGGKREIEKIEAVCVRTSATCLCSPLPIFYLVAIRSPFSVLFIYEAKYIFVFLCMFFASGEKSKSAVWRSVRFIICFWPINTNNSDEIDEIV